MCGIAGIWQFQTKTEQVELAARNMTRALAHRGPDDEGIWACEDIALGQRRLAIIDLNPSGHQPMCSLDGRYVLSFNGEIYNYKALADKLRAQNIPCEGRGDTQVLLQACITWGVEKTLPLLNGMFAFAFYDKQEKILSLARDRFGEKPLYYSFEQGCFAFGSELKALKALAGFKKTIDPHAVDLYLRLNYIPSPYTFYKEVKKLLPGRYLTISPTRGLKEGTYFDLEVALNQRSFCPLQGEALIDRLDDLLSQSVQDRMIADVPVGAFLSGGIDSSLMVACMQKQSIAPIKTFTVGFKNSPWDEAPYAEAIATHLKTDHTTLYIEPESILEYASAMSRLYDEPFGDASALSTHLVSKLFRKHVTVAIGGDGGDELFGGYHRHKWVPTLTKMAAYMPKSLLKVLVCLNKRFLSELSPVLASRANKALMALGGGHFLGTYLNSVSYFQTAPDWDKTWLRLHSALGETAEQVFYLDMRTYLHDDVLCKVDRASMAVGLETRAPFLDYDLVDFAWSIPLDQKFPNKEKKYLLKQLLGRYLPRHLWDRPKMGFGMPLADAFRKELRSLFETYLKADTLAWEHVDRRRIQTLWQQHLLGKVNHESLLWNCFVLQQCLLAE